MKFPNFIEEKKLWRKGFKYVAGLDEAGRGPLAGPVVASAVMVKPKRQSTKNVLGARPSAKIFNKNFGIRDSKQLTPQKREQLYNIITKHTDIEWGVGIVSEKVIDKINIKNAAELAMEKAVKNLNCKLQNKNYEVGFLIIDGNHLKNYKLKTINYKLITGGDQKVFSCAAASIVAKVTRDRIMLKYDKKYPGYGFKKHKGYPTKEHFASLQKFGPCPIHRKSFSPLNYQN